MLIGIAPHAQNSNPLTLKDFEGTWYVNMSNFPMWLKGKKQNPRFKYTKISDNKMLDEVSFEKKGKTKTIVGYDERSAEYKKGFIWTGKGIMSVFKSKWQVLYYNAKYKIAVLGFEKTLFTPAGYDVISRNKMLSTPILKMINELLPKLDIAEVLSVIEQE